MRYDVSENIKGYYDGASIEKIRDFVYGNERVEKVWKTIRSHVNNPSAILEIGCGIGAMCDRIIQTWPQAKVIGIDISDKSIDVASQLFQSQKCKFYNKLPATEDNKKKFDLILLIDVMEHVEKQQRPELIEFIENNLSENGMLFLAFPTPHMLDINRKNFPERLQPIEEDIFIADLQKISEGIKKPLVLYKEVFVWEKSDYAHAVFSDQLIDNPEKTVPLRYQIKKKMKSVFQPKRQQSFVVDKKKFVYNKLKLYI